MKVWSNYFDPQTGLLTQAAPVYDGGDTPSHEGLARVLAPDFNSSQYPSPLTIQDTTTKLILPNGLLIRNPINYNNSSDTSRDQYRSYVAALLVAGELYKSYIYSSWINEMWISLPRNFLGFRQYPNGDFYSPEDRTLFTRYKQSYLGRLLGDFCTFLNSLFICFWITLIYGENYTSNDVDHIAVCIAGAMVRPTFMNRVARWVYGKFRAGGVQNALDNYFADPNDPPVNTLGTNVIPRYFP